MRRKRRRYGGRKRRQIAIEDRNKGRRKCESERKERREREEGEKKERDRRSMGVGKEKLTGRGVKEREQDIERGREWESKKREKRLEGRGMKAGDERAKGRGNGGKREREGREGLCQRRVDLEKGK